MIEGLVDALNSKNALTTLDLSRNRLADESAELIARLIKDSAGLRTLNLGNTELGTHAILHISVALRENRTLTSIDLEDPRLFSLQEETTVHIARALQPGCSGLITLRLGKHGIRDYGVQTLCEILARNTTLTELDLRCNKITMEGAKSLANLLEANSVLCSLSLAHNAIRSEGAIALADCLRANRTLKQLNLSGCSIENGGLADLALALLEENRTLSSIFLWGNDFQQLSAKAFWQLLESKPCAVKVTDFRPFVCDETFNVARL